MNCPVCGYNHEFNEKDIKGYHDAKVEFLLKAIAPQREGSYEERKAFKEGWAAFQKHLVNSVEQIKGEHHQYLDDILERLNKIPIPTIARMAKR